MVELTLPAARNTILWAVDALTPSLSREVRALETALALFPGSGKRIEPVFAIPNDHFSFASEVYTARNLERCPEAYGRLRVLLPSDRYPRVLEPHFLTRPGNDRAEAAREVAGYARARGHEMIATTYSTRRPLARLFRERFLESLLKATPLPILVAPAAREVSPVTSVIYVTNHFSASRGVFERIAFWWGGTVSVLVGTERQWNEEAIWKEIAAEKGVDLSLTFDPSKRSDAELLAREVRLAGSALLILDRTSGLGSDPLPLLDAYQCPTLLVRSEATISTTRASLKMVAAR